MAAAKKKAGRPKRARMVKSDVRIDGKGAVRIQVPTDDIQQADAPTEKNYWLGAFPSCPMQNPTMGGHTFPRFRGTPVFDTAGNPDRPMQWGLDQPLTDMQVERIVHAVQGHVIRVLNKKDGKVEGPMLTIHSPSYRHQVGKDIPLAAFLYMVESDAATHTMRRDCTAPSMLDDAAYADLKGAEAFQGHPDNFGTKEDPDTDPAEGAVDMGPMPVGET